MYIVTPKYSIADFRRDHPDAVKVRRDANNTIRAFFPDGTETVTLHRTTVVTKRPNGSVVLNSGGWHTPTTKERINKELPAYTGISQKNYTWYVVQGKWEKDAYTELQRVPFRDGIILFKDGTILHPDDIPL